jgi:serine/threonine protein kinase
MPGSDVIAGEPFGKYVLVKRIAMGGMAEVCLARLQGTAGFNKLVVIKQVLPSFAESPQFVEMFLDEGRLAARLSHPNIAQTFELGEEAGRHYIAMEYVSGESLYAILKRCRELSMMLPLAAVLRVEMQLLEALDYAHNVTDDAGAPLHVVHRDITPSNVMVTHQGAIKLLDFGIARAATQVHRTEAGRVKGKGGYMAPEQCRSSKVDHRADIYGAGAILYLMATGMKPFEHLPVGTDLMGQMNATMEGSFLKPREVKKDLDARLEAIIVKAMALKPDDRYQSAGEMLDALEHFASAASVLPSPRELGELVKKFFPPRGDETHDLSREPSSSRATPGPPREEKKLATSESDAPAQTLIADEEDRTVAAAPAIERKPAVPIWAIAAGAVVMLGIGIALAALGGGSKEPVAPVSRLEPIKPPAPKMAPLPEPVKVAEPEPTPAPVEPIAEKPVHAVAVAPVKKKVIAAPKPAAEGKLSLNAVPWANVKLKGKNLGATPLMINLPAGTHQLELENPPLNLKRTITVIIKEGEQTTHFEKLQ